MTTETDKLVEMARESRATKSGTAPDELLTFSRRELAAFASAHIASLCGDVEPVAFMYPSDLAEFERKEMVAEAVSVSCTSVVTHERTVPLYSASTVAALKARVAELEKDAERYRQLRRGQKWSVVDGIGTVLRADELDAAIDAALTKGQLAPQPQQEQSK